MNTSSNDFINYLHQIIHEHQGSISFAQFMSLALYHPTFGYYSRPDFTLGKTGDFTTAPEISPLFAKCLAKQCVPLLPTLPAILEFGAGTGRLAADLLSEFDRLGTIPHYFIYEISLTLRQKQKTFIRQILPPHLFDRIVWLDTLPVEFKGIILANEVLDALPVHCFRIEETGIKERAIGWEKGQLTWKIITPISPTLMPEVSAIQARWQLAQGYESEINLMLPTFIQTMADILTSGVILLIDYGYGEAEYYHPERTHGTLTCFYQHQHHDNPLIRPGLQDITAHVNFTRVAEALLAAHCEMVGYTTQASFLLASDLLEFAASAENELSPIEQFQLHQAIKQLTMPTEMGERIKVMAFRKHTTATLSGFQLQDRRRDL